MERFSRNAVPTPTKRQSLPARKTTAIALRIESAHEFETRELHLIRGMVAGLALEAAMGLCAYSLWLGWRLLR